MLDCLTGDQRLFLAWAQVWRSKMRDELAVIRAKVDTHSPAKFRVNGIVRNLDAWYDAFSVQPNSALYLLPAERIAIW